MNSPIEFLADGATPPGAPDLLGGLAVAVVARLGAAAALVRPSDPASEAPAAKNASEARLIGVLPVLEAFLRDALAAGAARYLSLPSLDGAELAIVPVGQEGGERRSCLIALAHGRWSTAERIALTCMADAAAAEVEREREAEARARAERRVRMLEAALQAVDLGVTITDEQGRIVYANAAEARMHGYEPEELRGREARSLAPPELWAPRPGIPQRPRGRWARERTNLRRDGSRFPVRLCSEAIVDEGAQPVGMVTWCEDLTSRTSGAAPAARVAERPAAAERDALTDVLNRAAFLDRLQGACAAREAGVGDDFTLLFIDLDRFKSINDRHGHAAGDASLAAVGRRLNACVRPADSVGRVGGDEFAVLLHGIGGEAEVLPVVQRIQSTLAEPVQVGATVIRPSASIGIAVSADCGAPEELIASADRAMYRAKALGPGQFGTSEPGLATHDSAVGDLEQDLRRAIERDELVLHFQPIISLIDRRVASFEALVRWNHPERGLLGPQAFLPVAERTELIVDIDRWVLRAAARQMMVWGARFGGTHVAPLSINFSGRHVVRPDVVEHTIEVLREFDVPAAHLTVEVTETSMVEDAEAAASALTRLRSHGVRLALDDFGTGYSSLSYLQQLPFDILKIDRSFVQRVGHAATDRAIVRSVVALARTLGLSVTAEGVETAEQERVLRRIGCAFGQGYRFGRPMPEPEAVARIEREGEAGCE